MRHPQSAWMCNWWMWSRRAERRGGLLKHQQNLPRINKGFKKLTHKFKDINYEAEPQQSQELHKYIHWLTLFCNFLLFVCVCYNKRYSPRLSICMKISALVQECTFPSLQDSLAFILCKSALPVSLKYFNSTSLLCSLSLFSGWGDDITWRIRRQNPVPPLNKVR